MLIKSFVLGAALVSTPLCFLDVQGPGRAGSSPAAAGRQDPHAGSLQRTEQQLQAARNELEAARRDLADLRRQIDELLDIADQGLIAEPRRRGNQSCSPTRNRALLSHYQWLERNHHDQRAEKALAAVVEQAGNDAGRMAQMARELMTQKETAGQFDRVALALAQQIEKGNSRHRDARLLDTMALANFLNGGVEHAIELQQLAIANGGNNDDFRTRLRTYEAARTALVAAKDAPVTAPAASGEAALPAAIASANDDE
ncbi:MAG: hypothetical protein H6838_20070 [Planctomycetes bacterium]|nr:hypothetical protein [Planctomycetota bacterium]MCB9887793.1 hypothetical protein [Planctomycetota bacterium]